MLNMHKWMAKIMHTTFSRPKNKIFYRRKIAQKSAKMSRKNSKKSSLKIQKIFLKIGLSFLFPNFHQILHKFSTHLNKFCMQFFFVLQIFIRINLQFMKIFLCIANFHALEYVGNLDKLLDKVQPNHPLGTYFFGHFFIQFQFAKNLLHHSKSTFLILNTGFQ